MSTTIGVSVDDKVGTLALDNFAKRNALGAATVREMLRALSDFESGGVRSVVLRTAGPMDVWSARHDIDELPVRGVDPCRSRIHSRSCCDRYAGTPAQLSPWCTGPSGAAPATWS